MYLSRKQWLFLSVNVDHRRWLASKMTCLTCGRNLGKCRFGRSNATYLLIKCIGDALSVKLSPMTEILWKTTACSQNPSSPVRRSRLNDKCKKDIYAQSYDIQGQVQMCVELRSKFAHTTHDQLHNVCTLCLDDHQKKNRKMLSQIVKKKKTCIVLALDAHIRCGTFIIP